MWQRLILRELIPMLPRLLRLLPALEGFFFAERSAKAAARSETTQQLIADIERQVVTAAAESRRDALELQAKIEGSHQELQMVVSQVNELQQQMNQVLHRMRLLTICGIGAALALLATLIMIALVLARVSR
jgi:CHASE1-domain containing sensor protein